MKSAFSDLIAIRDPLKQNSPNMLLLMTCRNKTSSTILFKLEIWKMEGSRDAKKDENLKIQKKRVSTSNSRRKPCRPAPTDLLSNEKGITSIFQVYNLMVCFSGPVLLHHLKVAYNKYNLWLLLMLYITHVINFQHRDFQCLCN